MVSIGRGIGYWGDMVVELRNGDKIEMRALPRCAPAPGSSLRRLPPCLEGIICLHDGWCGALLQLSTLRPQTTVSTSMDSIKFIFVGCRHKEMEKYINEQRQAASSQPSASTAGKPSKGGATKGFGG